VHSGAEPGVGKSVVRCKMAAGFFEGRTKGPNDQGGRGEHLWVFHGA